MPRQAIRNEGAGAEKRFLELVHDARASDSAKRGDAIVKVDGVDCYVEVKHVTSNTINQIRAVKVIPLAIYTPGRPSPWLVLPGHEVTRLVYEKERGQHTELALESANLSRSGIPLRFQCTDLDLSARVHAAVREARRYEQLELEMQALYERLQQVKEEFRERVRRALLLGDAHQRD